MSRATALIEPYGGEVVAEYFDIGQSRSLPWKRRPESLALLEALNGPTEGSMPWQSENRAGHFRAASSALRSRCSSTTAWSCGCPRSVASVDPGSDAHDLLMSLYGGLSKGERNRIKLRVRVSDERAGPPRGPVHGWQATARLPAR